MSTSPARHVEEGRSTQARSPAVAGGRSAVTLDGQVRNRLAKSREMKALETDDAGPVGVRPAGRSRR